MAGRIGFGIVLLLACSYGLRFFRGAGDHCALPSGDGPVRVQVDGDTEMFAALEIADKARSSGRTAAVDASALRHLESLGYTGDDDDGTPLDLPEQIRLGASLRLAALR